MGSPKEAYNTSTAILSRTQEVATWLEYNNRKEEAGSFIIEVFRGWMPTIVCLYCRSVSSLFIG